MPKFVRRSETTTEDQNDLLAQAGVVPVRRSILIELAEVGVFEKADQLTRSALAEQFGLDLDGLDRIVDELEQLAEASYARRTREPVDVVAAEEDIQIAEAGLNNYVTRRRFAIPEAHDLAAEPGTHG